VVREARVLQGRQGRLLLPGRAEVQVEVRDVRLQRCGEPRRGWLVAGRLRAERVDSRRRGTHRCAREESGELRTVRTQEYGGGGFEPTEALRLQRSSRWLPSFANPSNFECSRNEPG